MLSISNPVEELAGVDARALPDRLLQATQPLVLRGLVADWPLVRAGLVSADAAAAYLQEFYRGAVAPCRRRAPAGHLCRVDHD